MMPAVEMQDVSHAYDRVPVLSRVSFAIAPGERVFIIGANGAGKSSAAKVVAGLVAPRSGTVRLHGTDITGWPAHRVAREGLRYVPAYRSVFPHLSVRDNLELGAEQRNRERQPGMPLTDRLTFVAAAFPALAERMTAVAGRLSGGMQRMVEVGRALMGEPRVVILDEPTLGLDGKAMIQMSEGLSRLRDIGTTLVVIEQNVPFATMLCDRGYLMSEGAITLAGAARDLLESAAVQQTYLGVV